MSDHNWELTSDTYKKSTGAFSSDGRMGRKEYIQLFLTYVVLTSVVGGCATMAAQVDPAHTTESTWVALATAWFLGILSLFPKCQRYHDLGMSGWFVWLTPIPIVGLIAEIFLWCMPGTQGPNRYGPDPVPGLKRKPKRPRTTEEKLAELARLLESGTIDEATHKAAQLEVLKKI